MQFLLWIPLLIFLPILGSFFYQPGSTYSDLLISHYPNAFFLHQSLFREGVLPLWSDRILSGFPFAANPLSGLWYPFGWLPVLFPAAWAFNLATLLHLVWGGYGVYRWLKLEGVHNLAAITGALAFEFTPKIWAHNSAGHITLLYAVCWTPWLLIAAKSGTKNLPRWSIWPSAVLGVILLADIRWAVFAGVLWLAYSLYLILALKNLRNTVIGDHSTDKQPHIPIGKIFLNLLAQGGSGLAAAAVLLIPLVEFTRLSTRSLITPAESLILSLPPARLIGILIPDWGGASEWIVYPGAVILMLALYLLGTGHIKPQVIFWFSVAGVSLLLSLGSYLPGSTILGSLPAFSLFRVPSRALFLFSFALITLCAYALDTILTDRRTYPKQRAIFTAALPVELALLIGGAVFLFSEKPGFNLIWGAALGIIGLLSIILWTRKKIDQKILWVILTGLILLDGITFAFKSIETRNEQEVFTEGAEAAAWIASQIGSFRVYSPSYSVPQQTAAREGLQLADGVDPMQLSSYSDYMKDASGVAVTGYSVTLPVFVSGNPVIDNIEAVPESTFLGYLNVGFVASEFPLESNGLILTEQFDHTYVYKNENVLPRAYIVEGNKAAPTQNIVRSVQQISPNEWVINAEGPGTLVLAEVAYPGWKVEVDGGPAEPKIWRNLFRAVQISPGLHEVRWIFQPGSVLAGGIISAITWIVLLVVGLWQRRIS